MALSKHNLSKYESTIEFLNNFIFLFKNLKIGRSWKTGEILTTKIVLDLQDLYLNQKNYSFLLTDKLTQDCLEK